MHILHKMNAHWRHDSLLHWRTWIEDKLNAFSKNKCVSEFTSQLFLYFLSCLHIRIKIFSPSFIKTVSSEWKRAFLCSILKCVENKLFFLLLNIITTKISSERTAALIMKKNRSHSVCLWQIEPKSTPTTWKPINPIHLQPHQNQLFTLMKSQNQNTGDL